MKKTARTLAWGMGLSSLAGGVLALTRVDVEVGPVPARMVAPSLTGFSPKPLAAPLDLLFLHHEAGALLLADTLEGPRGPVPGGGLRRIAEAAGYRVHTATFGSRFGEHNYLFDWLPKFRDHLPELLRIADQDQALPAGRRNQVVVFKSCRVNTLFTGAGDPPGDAAGPALTLANAQATFRALRAVFAAHPEVLFVYLTSPPFAPPPPERRGSRWWNRIRGRATFGEEAVAAARLNRRFHDWVVSPSGWLEGASPRNVVVFDYYDLLTREGASLFLARGGEGGDRNSVTAEANRAVARALVPFLNQAVRRAGLAD